MISLSKLLTESQYSNNVVGNKRRSMPIISSKVDNLIKRGGFSESFYNIHTKGNGIFRGVQSMDKETLYVKPSKHIRSSRNTENYYTWLLEFLPSWEKYPKRSRSIICSSDPRSADGYGTVYEVIPKNEALIGVCPESDFWRSFPRIMIRWGIYDMDYFNSRLSELCSIFGIKLEDITDREGFKNNLDKLPVDKSRLLDSIKSWNWDKRKVISDLEQNFHGNWIEYFDDLFDPEINGFTLQQAFQFHINGKAREVWTDSDCVLLKYNSDSL